MRYPHLHGSTLAGPSHRRSTGARQRWKASFYSAAVQAGSESWKAFFFGSSDAANSITVDKTPASLWVMALSVRIFGLSSWSILVPQALIAEWVAANYTAQTVGGVTLYDLTS
jgi:hypothetical protein